MSRVETQAVEAVFGQPINRVLDEETPHRFPLKVDRIAPCGRLVVVVEIGRVGSQVISVRSEMIVDDIQEDHQTQAVGGIDQAFQVLRRAVGGVRRIRQDAVITPIARPGEIGDRHQLDRRHPEFGKLWQPGGHPGEPAQGADMQLIDHRFMPWPASPVGENATGMPPDRRPMLASWTSPSCARDAGSGTARSGVRRKR